MLPDEHLGNTFCSECAYDGEENRGETSHCMICEQHVYD